MYKIVRQSEGALRRIAANKTANNLITHDISPEVSLATTEATDYYERETVAHNRIYYVLEGVLELTFNGETSQLYKGDACLIKMGTTYEMRGTFKAVVVNQPAFQPAELS